MGMLHGPAYCGRLLACLGAILVLAFTAVHAEVQPPAEVDADLDAIGEAAPRTQHVAPLIVLEPCPMKCC
jgi:hypothetical protein